MATGYVKQWVSKEIGRCVAAKERAVAQAVVGQWDNGTMGREDNGCIEQLMLRTMGPQDNGYYGNGIRQTMVYQGNRPLRSSKGARCCAGRRRTVQDALCTQWVRWTMGLEDNEVRRTMVTMVTGCVKQIKV